MKRDEEKEKVRAICQRLLEERKRQRISQQRLSELAGISRTGIRHIEGLETNPTLYSLLKVANGLSVNLADLLKGKP